jgi:hypothetical protein
LSESSDIDEEVTITAAKYSMKNDISLYKRRDDEEDNMKKSSFKYKITKIEENEDTDEVDVLDLINPNSLKTSKASNMVRFTYSKFNLDEKKKDEGKIIKDLNDSDEYSRIKYMEDDAQSDMHSVHNILTSRSKANFNFSPDKFEKPDTPKPKVQFIIPKAVEANNLLRRSVIENQLNTSQSNLKLRDNTEHDEYRTYNNYIKKLSNDAFGRKESGIKKDF